MEKLRIKSAIYLAQTEINCWNCRKEMTVLGLLAPTVLNAEDDAVCILSNIKELPEKLLTQIQSVNPNFQYRKSNTFQDSYYANVCPYCNKITGDHHLHSEPGGAFFPMEDEDIEKIRLHKIEFDEVIEIDSSYSMGMGEVMLEKGKMVC